MKPGSTFASRRLARGRSRMGIAMTEFAICAMPFFLMVFGIMEFGRLFMVIQSLNAAARIGAREGVLDGVNSAAVETAAKNFLKSANLDTKARVIILNGQGFDDSPTSPPSLSTMVTAYKATNPPVNYEVDDAQPRQLFIVRVEADFGDVALSKPWWVPNVPVYGQAVMRHE